MLTVIDPAATHRLTTLAMVKDELQLSSSDDDEVLNGLIDQASATAQSWCRRTFAEEVVEEIFHLDRPSSPLELNRYPVTRIATVTVAGAEIDPAEYEVEQDSGLLFSLDASANRRARFYGRVIVNYIGGYILPDAEDVTLPEDVQRAATLMVKGAYFARARDPAINSEAIPDVISASYSNGSTGDLPQEAAALLKPYRAPRIG